MNKTINENIIDKITEGLNDEQKSAILMPLNSCTKVVAGAGTGKTQIISRRFAKLVKEIEALGIEQAAERILVITFTDKAAGEMKGRIIQQLQKNKINYIGQDLSISTFHGFCSKILKKHSIEVNLSPSFALAEDTELKKIFDDIIKKIRYNETNTFEVLENICKELRLDKDILSIESINKLNKIDKVEKLLDSIFDIIKKIKAYGYSPLEFMQKSISSTINFSDCVKNIPFGYDSKEQYVMDWDNHLKEYIADNSEINEEIFEKIAKEKIILDKRGKRKPEEYTPADNFYENIDKITDYEIHFIKVIAVVYALYQKQLEILDICDFDDLINKTIEILDKNNEIRKFYQNLYKHIIIDEFQDTNGSQLRLIKLLLSNEDANITFVGDRKQSIYGFRFAQMENLDTLHKDIEDRYQKKYEPIQLKYNYRSTAQVLNAVNFVTQEQLNLNEKLHPNPNLVFVDKENYVQVTPIKNFTNAEDIKIKSIKYIASEIVKIKKEDEKVTYKDFAVLVRSHAQAELIDKELEKYGIPSIKKVNVSFFKTPVIKNSIALFKLTNNIREELALFQILRIQLSELEIYKFKKLIDEEILKTKTYSELREMNLSDKLAFIYEKNHFETINCAEETKEYIKKILNIFFEIQKEKSNLSLLQIYYKLLSKIDLHKETGINKYKADLNIKIFEKVISNFMQTKNYVSVKTFLEELEKNIDNKNFELPEIIGTETDAVQIVTVHASKGLEYPYTFVMMAGSKDSKSDNTSAILDLQFSDKPGFGIIAKEFAGDKTAKAFLYNLIWKTPRDKQESLRLFYVAVTRAEKYLNILSYEDYGPNGKEKAVDYIRNFKQELIAQSIDVSDLNIERQQIKYVNLSLEQIKENKINEIIPEQNSFSLSFSKLNLFNHCENKYLYKYQYHFPEVEKEKLEKQETKIKIDSAKVGSMVHNLIYTSYINKKSLSKEEQKELIEISELTNEEKERVDKLYNLFLASNYIPEKLKDKEVFPEKAFNFNFEIENKIIDFNGDIDLLLKNEDGSFSILDFKTNKNIEKSLPDYFKQLYLYKKALKNENIEVKEAKLLNLTEDGIKEFVLKEDDEKDIDTSIIKEITRLINTTDFKELEKTDNCLHCGYYYLCD